MRKRSSDRPPHVEATPISATSALRQTGRQLPGQGSNRGFDSAKFLAGGMHQVGILNEWLSERPRHRFCATVGDKPTHDLAAQLRTQHLHQRGHIVSIEPDIKLFAGRVSGKELLDTRKTLQDPVEVVPTTNRPSGLKPREARDCGLDRKTQCGGITATKRRGQLPHELADTWITLRPTDVANAGRRRLVIG
jgi:hypothetical protein